MLFFNAVITSILTSDEQGTQQRQLLPAVTSSQRRQTAPGAACGANFSNRNVGEDGCKDKLYDLADVRKGSLHDLTAGRPFQNQRQVSMKV